MFTDPDAMLALVPMELDPTERAKTRWALTRMFGRAVVESVRIRPEPGDPTGRKTPGATVGPPGGPAGVLPGRGADPPLDVHIVLRHVDLFGLDLDRLTMRARGLKLDPAHRAAGTLVIDAPAEVAVEAKVFESALNRVAGAHHIQLSPGAFILTGRKSILFVRSSYRLRGELDVEGGERLILIPQGLSYGFLSVPDVMVDQILSGVNPLFDLKKFLGSTRTWVDLVLVEPVLESGHLLARIRGRFLPGQAGE